MITVAVSGYFDPLNGRGHISYIQEARKLGDKLVLILNNNAQLMMKKGRKFYPSIEDRLAIIRELRSVDEVVVSIDTDMTQAKTLMLVKPDIVAQGGDRDKDNIPEAEMQAYKKLGCQVVYNVGDEKRTSSQELVRNYLT